MPRNLLPHEFATPGRDKGILLDLATKMGRTQAIVFGNNCSNALIRSAAIIAMVLMFPDGKLKRRSP